MGNRLTSSYFAENKPEFHYLRKPSGFSTGMAWGNLGYQMRYSVESLEKHLIIEGTPHVLQLNFDRDGNDWRNPTEWRLYADGHEVARGSGAFARQRFEESAEAFRNLCRDAIAAAKLEPLTDREFWLLDRARAIAAVEPFDDGRHIMGGRPCRV